MRYFRRVTSGIVARVDEIIGQIENHDALVESALRDVRRGSARAKVSLGRVRKDGVALRERHESSLREREAWKRRAIECRDSDEERAIECLRRAKLADREVHTLERRMVEHDAGEQRLAAEVRALDLRVHELQDRHNQMRTRQACVQGVACIDGAAGATTVEIESAFDRWEVRLAETEVTTLEFVDTDPFAREFESAEALDDLRAELRELEG